MYIMCTFLTQQIKLYVAKKSIIPEIDDSYIAAAHNDETWMDELKANKHQIVIVVYCTPALAAAVFIIFVVVFVGTACCSCKDSLRRARETEHAFISNRVRSATAAIAIISAVHIAYALLVSCYACVAIQDQPEPILKSSPLANISIMVAAVDGVLLLLCIATDIGALFVAVHYSFDHAYIVLGCTLVYASLSILLHCPYIILAYINDAELTGSMFVFYTVSWGLMFLAISRFYIVYHKLVLPCHAKILNACDCNHDEHALRDNEEREPLLGNAGNEENGPHDNEENRPTPRYSKVFCESFIFILYSLPFSILVLGSVALLTCYLVVLPITNGLSHLFGRLIDTYHTAIVIVGAFVAYKTFIERRN